MPWHSDLGKPNFEQGRDLGRGKFKPTPSNQRRKINDNLFAAIGEPISFTISRATSYVILDDSRLATRKVATL